MGCNVGFHMNPSKEMQKMECNFKPYEAKMECNVKHGKVSSTFIQLVLDCWNLGRAGEGDMHAS